VDRTQKTPSRRPRRWLSVVWIGIPALGLALVAWIYPLGPPLVQVTSPISDVHSTNEAIEVLLRFPRSNRTRPETLRVLINGADVTEGFDVASNGAIGDVALLVDGENRLEVSVFGRAWWGGQRLVEHRAELRITVRRPVDRYWG
jgi:hypothetical protein